MWPFRKRLKPPPRDLDLSFEGTVKRIQFNSSGGFKMTVEREGKTQEWWVPNDPGNRHCQFIRQWICDGGFPEDADPIAIPRFLGVTLVGWRRIEAGLFLFATIFIAVGTLVMALK